MPELFPLPLDRYPAAEGLLATLLSRARHEPFNLVPTAIFLVAILHTFAAKRFTVLAHRVQEERARALSEQGLASRPSVAAELLHFLGEIEVVFGLWAVLLVAAISARFGWEAARSYLEVGVNYGEAVFVVVIMALASTRPVLSLAERALSRLAALAGGSPAAFWVAILTVAPVLGSFITEPAAMTIAALLLGRQVYERRPSARLAYATLGLLFVNVSVGGTLSHFAAPPVLMVARAWGWTTPFMLSRFGWKAVLGILAANLVYLAVFWRDLRRLASSATPAAPDQAAPAVPAWITLVNLAFMGFTVANAHHPVLFVGAFLFFLGFARASARDQGEIDLKPPILVGFFLAGLVIHGGLQGWWIAPVLASLSETPLFTGALVLTAFNDNALITFLATLVPGLSEGAKQAVVAGAVAGGGLTVIANAPNPAGQAILGRHFESGISPLGLLLGALPPTAIVAAALLLL